MKQYRTWGSGLSPFFVPEDFLPSHPSVKSDLQTDVLVIGAGLSGLLCAYSLIKAGREVTVVTANTVGDGASRFSSGVLFGDGGVDLSLLRKRIGRAEAVAWYRYAAASVEQLEKIVDDTGSRCELRRRDGFYYTAFPKQAEALREEWYLRHHIGLPCRWMGEEECAETVSFPCAGGILLPGASADLNCVRLCRDLADWITVRGGSVLEGSRIDSIETGNGEDYVCLCGSFRITAKAVVDARGGDVLEKRPQLGRRVTVFSVVTEPLSCLRGLPENSVVRSRDEIFCLRTTPDGRIVFSGEASSALTPDGRMGALDANALCRVKYNNLEGELREMLFGIPRIRREYGFCQGLVLPGKGLPYVGRDLRWPGLYYLYAFGEGGLAGAILGAAWIGRMITDPDVHCPEYLSLQ